MKQNRLQNEQILFFSEIFSSKLSIPYFNFYTVFNSNPKVKCMTAKLAIHYKQHYKGKQIYIILQRCIMSLLDSLFQCTAKNYTNERGQSLTTKIKLSSTQQQSDDQESNRFRSACKSVSKPIKSSKQQQKSTMLAAGKALYKLNHILNKKIRMIRYFVLVKLETLKKMNWRILNQQPVSQPNESNNTRKQALDRISQSFNSLYLKQYSTKIQSNAFKMILNQSHRMLKLRSAAIKLQNTLNLNIKSTLRCSMQSIKDNQKYYLKTEIFVEVFYSYYKKCVCAQYKTIFGRLGQIPSKQSKVQRQSTDLIISPFKQILGQKFQQQQQTSKRFSSIKKKIILGKKNTDEGSQLKLIINQSSLPVALQMGYSPLISTKVNEMPIMSSYQQNQMHPRMLNRLYPDQISNQIQDILDNSNFFIQPLQKNHDSSYSAIPSTLRSSNTSHLTLCDNFISEIQKIKQKQQKFNTDFMKHTQRDRTNSLTQNVTPQKFNKFAARESLPNNTIIQCSLPTSIQKMKQNPNMIRKIKKACIDIQTTEQNDRFYQKYNMKTMGIDYTQPKGNKTMRESGPSLSDFPMMQKMRRNQEETKRIEIDIKKYSRKQQIKPTYLSVYSSTVNQKESIKIPGCSFLKSVQQTNYKS